MGSYYAVESYSNGREQGLCIVGWDFRACVAENRNSDHIVVYMTKKGEHFDMAGNVPTDRAYEERKLFGPDEHERASNYIFVGMLKDWKSLTKELKKVDLAA